MVFTDMNEIESTDTEMKEIFTGVYKNNLLAAVAWKKRLINQ